MRSEGFTILKIFGFDHMNCILKYKKKSQNFRKYTHLLMELNEKIDITFILNWAKGNSILA